MIKFNDKKFARNKAEFNSNDCIGYYTPYKNQVVLYDSQYQKIGTVTKNNVLLSARKLDNGKYWYTFSTIKIIGEYDDNAQRADIQNALKELI